MKDVRMMMGDDPKQLVVPPLADNVSSHGDCAHYTLVDDEALHGNKQAGRARQGSSPQTTSVRVAHPATQVRSVATLAELVVNTLAEL